MKRYPSTTARTYPASRVSAGTLALALAAAVLAMLLSLWVPHTALAQEDTSGITVGKDGVSINGGQVFAGDGCAKAGDVVVGDCEEGKAKKGDGPGDDSGVTPEDAGAEPSEDQYGDEDSSQGEAGESTVLESTTSEDDGGGTQQVTETTQSTTDVVEDGGAGAEPEADPATAEDPDEGCAVEGPMGETATTTVEEVIDGDTVETPEVTVRLIGVDTPETVDPGEPVEPGGQEASGFTAAELEGEEVELELGKEPEDDYGRTLAYVWTEDGSGEPVMFNEVLLREGLGELLIIPPNDEYERCLVAAEKAAQDEGVGMWAEGAGGAEPVPADAPPESEISPSDQPNDSEDATSDAPAQDQYADEEAVEPAIAGEEEAAPQEGAVSAADDQYEEAAEPPAPTDEPEIQEEEIQEPEIQEPEVQEEEVREPRVRSTELADAPVGASAELPDDASVPATPAPAAPTEAAPITTLPETGGASVVSSAAGTLLVCSGLLAARLACAPRRDSAATRGDRTRD